MRKKRKTVRKKRSGCTKVILLMVLIAAVIVCVRGIDAGKSAEQIVQKYADRHNIYMSEYPDEMIQLLASNKETKKFVLEYPEKKDLAPEISLDKEVRGGGVPRLLQWDQRWGYREYGDGIIGITGCGSDLSFNGVHISYRRYKYEPVSDGSVQSEQRLLCKRYGDIMGAYGKRRIKSGA